MMIIQCGVLLLFLRCARTTENIYGDVRISKTSDFSRFSLWPSYHNAATVLRIRRDLPSILGEAGPNEGTDGGDKPPADSGPIPSVAPSSKPTAVETKNVPKTDDTKSDTPKSNQETTSKGNTTVITAETPVPTQPPNVTSTEKPKPLDLNSPGVVKRGLIVFGGFALMALAYLVFYKRKSNNHDMSNSLGMNDANQFRYGVLQNEDTKDNLESSRIPLTMESDDEIEEDLEIFDLVQKKKSLSYVNLQQNDEDIVLSPREDIEGDNLLLDIEDANSDTLINWSNNGSKSIL